MQSFDRCVSSVPPDKFASRGNQAALFATAEVDVSNFIAPGDGSPVRMLLAQARGLIRLVAIAAVLAIAIQPSATSAAESGTDTDRAGMAPVIALGAPSAIDCGGKAAGGGFSIDDGEDRLDEGDDEFGEGDDEFDCDDFDEGSDECDADRIAEGDDECEGGCVNFDDGEDRCLDDGEDHFDEGDDDFGAGLDPTRADATDALPSATLAAASNDLSAPGALAAVIGFGAGGLWLLRRAKS
jgi:hypothetical protein